MWWLSSFISLSLPEPFPAATSVIHKVGEVKTEFGIAHAHSYKEKCKTKSHTRCSHTVLTCGHLFLSLLELFTSMWHLKTDLTHMQLRAHTRVCVCVCVYKHVHTYFFHTCTYMYSGEADYSVCSHARLRPSQLTSCMDFLFPGLQRPPGNQTPHNIFTMSLHHESAEAPKCIMQSERELWQGESWFCLTFSSQTSTINYEDAFK